MPKVVLRGVTFLLALVLFCQANVQAESESWQNLLDEDLSKWEIYIGVPHKSVEIPGREPSKSEDGTKGEPLGLGNDPLNIFTVKMVDDEPVLHITGEIYGGLTTLDEFDSYHLQLQFRWGEKKWPPRLNRKRDSGILIHCVGRHGAFWNVWMRCLECQVQEGDCGDFIPLAGSRASMRAKPNREGKRPIYDPQGEVLQTVGYATHGPSEEKPNGEWNTIDVYTVGDKAVFVVNGTPNMAIFNTRQHSRDGDIPLTRGRIQIQSEAAEVEYRRIRLRPIDSFPESLSEHVDRAKND